MSPRLAFAIETAVMAGRRTLGWFQTGTAIERKGDDSPVTVADREAERLIRARIEDAFPGEAILGEEEGETGLGRDRWVIDPIDGTKTFVAGAPTFSTLLSYELDGEPVLGVCYVPALDELYYAERGQGAYCNGRACRVSEKTALHDSIVCYGGLRSLAQTNRLAPLVALSERLLATRGFSDAYGHMLVASGRVEAMIDPILAHWDVSPVAVIVREAGGSFTDFQGGEALAAEAVSCGPGVRDAILEAFCG